MNITSTELKSFLKRLSAAKSDRVVFDSDKGRLMAIDQDITVVVENPKLVGDFGVLTVNAQKFSAVVSRMSGVLGLVKKDNHLVVSSSKAKVEIELGTGKVPSWTVPSKLLTLPLTVIKPLLQYASSGAHKNKAATTGGVVQLATVVSGIEEQTVVGFKAAGTDDNRIAFVDGEGTCAVEFKYLLPLPAVTAIQNFEGETFEVAHNESFFFLRSGDVSVFASKLAKTFPDYQAYIPKQFAFEGVIPAEEFKSALHLVEPMLDPAKVNAVLLHFLDGTLRISTVGNGGHAEDTVEYRQVTPDPVFADSTPFTIPINHGFLSDFVSGVSGEILFRANSSSAPAVLEAGNRKLMVAAVANA